MAKFDRKITVVVGCATGIGNVLAKRFAYEGATVILCDIQEEKGKAAYGRNSCSGRKRRLLSCRCNQRKRNRSPCLR